MNLKTRLEQLEAYQGRADAIAFITLYDECACLHRWSGRTQWIPLLDALPYLNDPSIKVYEASDSFDPEAI